MKLNSNSKRMMILAVLVLMLIHTGGTADALAAQRHPAAQQYPVLSVATGATGWSFLPVDPNQSEGELHRPGFQGHLQAARSVLGQSKIYEINVYAYKEKSNLAADTQIQQMMRGFQSGLAAHTQVFSDIHYPLAHDRFAILQTPFGDTGITTVLLVREVLHSIVVVEAVLRDPVEQNVGVNMVKDLLPQLQFQLRKK